MRKWAAVCRFGGIGDNLIASSVLPLLARDYAVEVICQDPYHVLFENNPYIEKLTVKQPGELPSGSGLEWQQWFVARGKEYAKFVHLSHSCEISLALVPAQTQFYWPAAMRRKLCGRSYLEFVHDIAEVPHEFSPNFFPTDEELAKADDTKRRVGEKVIGWALSGSRVDKIYPQSAAVVARLIKETGCPVIMFGGGQRDFDMSKQIMEQVERQNGSLEGLHQAVSPDPSNDVRFTVEPGATHVTQLPKAEPLWPVRRSITQLQRCDLVIGPDTGLMWSVAAHSMPKIMLLSHASPENVTKHWRNTVTLHADPVRVPCWPCHQLHDSSATCTQNKDNTGAACISDISAEAVLQAAKDMLAKSALRLVA